MDAAEPKLAIFECFEEAWRSFRKWWIPICVVSALVVLFNILPRLLAWDELQAVRSGGSEMIEATAQLDMLEMERRADHLNRLLLELAGEFVQFVPLILPLTAVLTIVLLLYANRAVRHERRNMALPAGRVIYAALVHFLLALVKALAFFCCVVPGVYIYIKLYFVPLAMLESDGALAAIRRSWHLTSGSFWQLLAIVFINGTIQILAFPSIIGAIPATGYANTVRAAAYRRLSGCAPPPPPPPVP